MQENVIKSILLATNLCLWASGWAVLAVGVYLMSGENGRHYAVILLGQTHQTTDPPPTSPMSWMETDGGGLPSDGVIDRMELLTSSAEPPGSTKAQPEPRNSTSADPSYEEMAEATEALDVKLEATLLVLGSLVVMAGLVGCIAASQNDRTLLLAYCSLMIAVGLADGGAGIWCLKSASQNQNEVSVSSPSPVVSSSSTSSSASADQTNQPLQRLHQWYGAAGHTTYTEALNAVQEQLSCCGITGPNDYVMSYWHHIYSPGKTILPKSCCFPNVSSSASTVASFTEIQCENTFAWPHLKGCLEILPAMIRSDYFKAGTALIVISILQIIGATATLILRKQIKTMTCGELPPLETVLF
ncbi:CD151 antigen-like [Palaemon carinicauda]|uniref:CD151 antigen-like n=1 Tax=Palaemon carinicauda TaxID=392227 RepID=UPI0035B60AA6